MLFLHEKLRYKLFVKFLSVKSSYKSLLGEIISNNVQLSIPRWLIIVISLSVALSLIIASVFVIVGQIAETNNSAKQTELVTKESESAQAEEEFNQIMARSMMKKLERAVNEKCLNSYDGIPAMMNLSADGKTLVIISTQPYQPSCILQELGFPDSTLMQIRNTRVIDGMQTVVDDHAKAIWSYIPDSGLTMTIEITE